MERVLATISLLVAASLIYLVGLAIYRLFFSRIAHIPGPKLAALTYFYQFYYDCYPHQGRFLWQCKALHERYGPVVRIGPDEIHINDPDFYGDIYSSNARKRNKSRLWFWMIGSGEITDNSIFATLDHDLHRLRRAGFSPFFSKRMVQQLEPRLSNKVAILKQRLLQEEAKGEAVDLYNAFSGFTLDVVSEYVLGRAVGALERSDYGREWNTFLREGVVIHPWGRAFPTLVVTMLLSLKRTPKWLLPKSAFFQAIAEFTEISDNILNTAYDEAVENKRNGSTAEKTSAAERTVLHSMLLNDSLPPEEKTKIRLCADGFLALGAGTETTARTLTITLYHILADSSVHGRLLQELRTVMPLSDSPLPSVAVLEKLPYLTAVIHEGTRMGHGTAGRMARIAPDEDLQCGEITIPRGTTMSQSNYLVHTHPKYFPDPMTFKPERYMGPDSADALKHLVPFGKGARACVGLNLAYSELYLAIAAIVAGVKMELFETTDYDAQIQREYFVGLLPKDSQGIRVKVLGKAE